MKKNEAISTALGLTQRDAALLFGVNRSQWSMFELGRRDLPLPASKRLADVLVHIRNTEPVQVQPSAWQENQQKQLACWLRQNEHRQLLVGKKIAALQKKQLSRQKLLQLLEFLNDKTRDQLPALPGLPEVLAARARRNQDAEALLALTLKAELLALEQLLLQAELRRISESQPGS